MILYFTGTGNSYDIALKLADSCGEEVSPINSYKSGEKILGIVFPVYFGGLPIPVKEFFENADLTTIEYLYAVPVYGGGKGGAENQIRNILKKRNLKLDACFGILTPDNYVISFNPPSEKQAAEILDSSHAEAEKTGKRISAREKTSDKNILGGLQRKIMYPLYLNGRKTKKFTVNENCVKCGKCAANCPDGAIEIKESVIWIKPQCSLCLACINR